MTEPTKAGFFCENNGNQSSMRLMCFMSLIAAIGFGVVAVTKPPAEGGTGTNLSLLFLGASVGGKVGQKFAEVM